MKAQDKFYIYRNYDIGDELKKERILRSFKFLPGLGFYGFGLTHDRWIK